jgi:hypothetical protein
MHNTTTLNEKSDANCKPSDQAVHNILAFSKAYYVKEQVFGLAFEMNQN